VVFVSVVMILDKTWSFQIRLVEATREERAVRGGIS
jgi:hypothetical protein